MKKLSLSLLLVMCVSMAHAEFNPKQSVGLQIGFAEPISRLNSPSQSDITELGTNAIYNGMKVGVVYDATLIKGFGFSLGLNYTFGGGNTDWMSKYTTSLYPKSRSRYYYHQLEVPIDWQYKFEIAKGTWLILYTGPTLQCGLSLYSREYLQQDTKDISQGTVTDYYNATSEGAGDRALHRFNVTWGVGAGFQYQRYFIRGGYDFGIMNPYKAFTFTEGSYTRGRFDQWQIKVGIYLAEF